jgi:hypothetical protein
MSLQQRGFNDPAYQVRNAAFFGAIAAGSGGVTSKFVAFAALNLMSLSTYTTVAGSSTYTNTVNGVGTATISAQQLSVIVIQNTATQGATAALSTTTIGPFIAGGGFVGGGTGTGQVGGINNFALNTATSVGLGVANIGGVPIPALSQFYVVSGTDTSAVNLCTIDYQIAQQAPLTL